MVQDALGGASWCDAVGELPPELIVEDVGMLLQSSAAVQHATGAKGVGGWSEWVVVEWVVR